MMSISPQRRWNAGIVALLKTRKGRAPLSEYRAWLETESWPRWSGRAGGDAVGNDLVCVGFEELQDSAVDSDALVHPVAVLRAGR